MLQVFAVEMLEIIWNFLVACRGYRITNSEGQVFTELTNLAQMDTHGTIGFDILSCEKRQQGKQRKMSKMLLNQVWGRGKLIFAIYRRKANSFPYASQNRTLRQRYFIVILIFVAFLNTESVFAYQSLPVDIGTWSPPLQSEYMVTDSCCNYDSNQYKQNRNSGHTGIDLGMGAAVSLMTPVKAIAEGTIVGRRYHCNNNTPESLNLSVVLIEHKTSNGDIFTGVYGHTFPVGLSCEGITSKYNENKDHIHVLEGETIGYLAKYGDVHLHFGVSVGASVNNLFSGWGRYDSSFAMPNNWRNPETYLQNNIKPSLSFNPTSYSELLKNFGQLSIKAPGSNQSSGGVVLLNGPGSYYALPAVFYKADIIVAPANWTNSSGSTFIDVNIFSPSSLGNLAITSGSPAIDEKFPYPVKIQAFGAIDPVSSIAPLLGEKYYPFSDVNPNHWASCYIMKLWRNGIVNGQAGLYKPEDPVTRAEFLKMAMIARYGSYQFPAPTTAPYEDVPVGQWYAKYVAYAKSKGILAALSNSCIQSGAYAGYLEKQCFVPNDEITRVEAVSIITKAFDLPAVSSSRAVFRDAEFSNPFYSTYLYPAVNSKGTSGCGKGDQYIVSGYSEGLFKPYGYIQRDQAAKIIALAMGLKKEQ